MFAGSLEWVYKAQDLISPALKTAQAQAKQMKTAMGGLGDQLDDLKRRNVQLLAGLKQSADEVPGLSRAMELATNPFVLAGAAVAGVGLAMKSSIDAGMEYESALAELSAITGLTGDKLNDLGERAKAAAAKFGGSATANLAAFQNILSVLGPEIAQVPEALDLMNQHAQTLAKTMKGDVEGATAAMTSAMKQFGVDLSNPMKAAAEMARMMNVMAAGAQAGAAEVPDIAEAIKVSGAMAKVANISFEETNAAIQVLAEKSIKGAEAGTALRNVMAIMGKERFLPKDTREELEAAGVDLRKLADNGLTMGERLKELHKIYKDDALVAQFFGMENVVAGRALLDNIPVLEEYTKKVTGTNTAMEMANTIMNTGAERMKRWGAILENIKIDAFGAMQPAINWIMDGVELIASEFGEWWKAVQPVYELVWTLSKGPLAATWWVVKHIVGLWWESMKAVMRLFGWIAKLLQPIAEVSAMLWDGLVGIWDWAIEKAGQFFSGLWGWVSRSVSGIWEGIWSTAKEVFDEYFWKPVKDNFSWIIDPLVAGIKAAADYITEVFEKVKAFILSLKDINPAAWFEDTPAAAAATTGNRFSRTFKPFTPKKFPGLDDKADKTKPTKTKKEVDAVVSGGRQPVNLTYNIGKIGTDSMTVNVQGAPANIPPAELERKFSEWLLRISRDSLVGNLEY